MKYVTASLLLLAASSVCWGQITVYQTNLLPNQPGNVSFMLNPARVGLTVPTIVKVTNPRSSADAALITSIKAPHVLNLHTVDCDAPLQPGQSCYLTFVWTPTRAGQWAYPINIILDGQRPVTLFAVGVGVPLP